MLMQQNANDMDWEMSENNSEDLRESTLSSDIYNHQLHNHQDVLHSDQVHHDTTIQTIRLPLSTTPSHADTFSVCTSLPDL
jgi:hypothetical protein